MSRFLPLSLMLLGASIPMLASVDSELLSLLPSNAKLVSCVDVLQARNSAFGQYLLSKSQTEDANFQQFVQETGFDPRMDLQQIVFESPGSDAGQKQGFAILARGTFDQDRIKATALSKGATTQSYSGVEMLVRPGGSPQTAVVFLESDVAMMADLVTAKTIIANRGSQTVFDPALQDRINAIGNNNDAWFVSLTGGSFLAHRITRETNQPAPQQAKALESVLQASGGVHFGNTIQMSLDALTRSPQDATSLADVVRFVASMIQMQRQSDTRAGIVASSLDNMTLQTSGDTMRLSISMPEKNLEQLAELGPRPNHRAH